MPRHRTKGVVNHFYIYLPILYYFFRLPAIWLVLQCLVRRLQNYWDVDQKMSGEELTVGVASNPPIQDLFMEIDAHFIRRKKQKELLVRLLIDE